MIKIKNTKKNTNTNKKLKKKTWFTFTSQQIVTLKVLKSF